MTTSPVTVYSKPACVQCDATYRALDKRGINYDVVDLTQDPKALELVRSLGYLQAPVVVAGDATGPASAPTRSPPSLPSPEAARAVTWQAQSHVRQVRE